MPIHWLQLAVILHDQGGNDGSTQKETQTQKEKAMRTGRLLAAVFMLVAFPVLGGERHENEYAFPALANERYIDRYAFPVRTKLRAHGLTTRDYIAIQVYAALAGSGRVVPHGRTGRRTAARLALQWADAFIEFRNDEAEAGQ